MIFCAVGRSINRPDHHAGLNWSAPCFGTPVDTLDLGDLGCYHLCAAHYHVIFTELEERLLPEFAVTVVWHE